MVTWLFSVHHCLVNIVVCLPYCLISGTWWSKRATQPKKHVPGGINSNRIRGDCGLWSVWSYVLAFPLRDSLHIVKATRLKTRKLVDRWQTHRKHWSFWSSFSLFTAGQERTGRGVRHFFGAIRNRKTVRLRQELGRLRFSRHVRSQLVYMAKPAVRSCDVCCW